MIIYSISVEHYGLVVLRYSFFFMVNCVWFKGLGFLTVPGLVVVAS